MDHLLNDLIKIGTWPSKVGDKFLDIVNIFFSKIRKFY